MSSNTNVVLCKLKGKRVFRFSAVAVVGVNTHIIHNIFGNKLLLFYREISEKRRIINLRLFFDFFDKRNNMIAKSFEKFVAFFHIKPAFIHIKLNIIGVFIGFIIFCKTDSVIKKLFKAGLERFKIIFFLGAVPNISCLAYGLLIRHIFVCGNIFRKLIVAHKKFDFSVLVFRKFAAVGLKVFQKVNGFF